MRSPACIAMVRYGAIAPLPDDTVRDLDAIDRAAVTALRRAGSYPCEALRPALPHRGRAAAVARETPAPP